jgi:hypothetical protein
MPHVRAFLLLFLIAAVWSLYDSFDNSRMMVCDLFYHSQMAA